MTKGGSLGPSTSSFFGASSWNHQLTVNGKQNQAIGNSNIRGGVSFPKTFQMELLVLTNSNSEEGERE